MSNIKTWQERQNEAPLLDDGETPSLSSFNACLAEIKELRRALSALDPLHIGLGYGRIEVGQGHHGEDRLPAILFGRNGLGEVGLETEGNRVMEPGECIAAITFTNRASLEVVAEKIDELRARIWPEGA